MLIPVTILSMFYVGSYAADSRPVITVVAEGTGLENNHSIGYLTAYDIISYLSLPMWNNSGQVS